MTKPTHAIKIVSCCYCGARSTFSAKPGQRLVCHGCGASITKLAALQPDMERQRKAGHNRPKPSTPHRAEKPHEHLAKDRPVRRKKGKRKKRSIWYHVAEAFDDLDDVFDIFD